MLTAIFFLYINLDTKKPYIIKEPKEKSLSEENLNTIMYFYNENGQLVAAYRYYWYAGAESYGEILVLDAKMA